MPTAEDCHLAKSELRLMIGEDEVESIKLISRLEESRNVSSVEHSVAKMAGKIKKDC